MTTPYDYGLSADQDATWSQVTGIPDGSHVVRDSRSPRLFFDPEPEDQGTSLSPVPGFEPREYVTEISVPDFGDGRQALYSPGLREPGPEPEAE